MAFWLIEQICSLGSLHSKRRMNKALMLYIDIAIQSRVDIHVSRVMRKRVMSCVNNKGADQPTQLRSLISAFVVRCLDNIISLDSIAEISRL